MTNNHDPIQIITLHMKENLKTLYDLFKEGGNEVTMEKLFDKYEEVSEKFEFEATKLARNLDVIFQQILKEIKGNQNLK